MDKATNAPGSSTGAEPHATSGGGEPGGRDRTLDGFRAVAVLAVILSHAVNYRYQGEFPFHGYLAGKFVLSTEPLSEAGVYLFFAISGYIITTLMLREEARQGRFSLAAFYVRRSLRILPPLFAFLATVALLGANGLIAFEPRQTVSALAFTCNTGLTDCGWFVAHTWSLAVEEQYYLLWPLLFTLLPPVSRHRFAAAVTAVLLIAYLLQSVIYHSNAISFACIAAGACCALQPRWREALERAGGYGTLLLAAVLIVVGPQVVGKRAMTPFLPLLMVFVLFGTRRVRLVRAVLESAPFQFIGRMSYSLYLWQQLFLAMPEQYWGIQPLPVWLLPVVAWGSLVVIERPCIALAHRLSRELVGRRGRSSRSEGCSVEVAADRA